ncbi:MAG: MEKHLA domain-containing protein, partial [Cyanobium sp.]
MTPASQQLVGQLLASHARAFDRPLLAGLGADATPLQWSQALFAAATVVLAHDGADPGGDPGPRLIYANRAALQLWRRPWAELVGMPSRLTAEPAERAGRAQALASVHPQHAIADYCGIRIDSRGRRFQISGARVWSL